MNSSVGGTALCFIGATIVLAFFFLATAIRIVPAHLRLVVFRLGRPLDTPKGPGIAVLIPTIDRSVTVDLREQSREISDQEATTKDFIPVSIDFRWYYKVLDPVKVVVSVGNIEAVTAGLISTELRKMIREIDSGHLSSEHGRICNEISTEPRLREALEGFGVVMTSFEIMKLVVDDRKKQMDEANSSVGTFGETQTTVHNSGTVIIGDRVWDAMSAKPIAPKSRVRVKRVVLEIEEDASTR